MIPVIDTTVHTIPERVRCTACDAETSAWMLANALATVEWVLVEGFWFCAKHAPAAPWIVALDRERNAHQVTMLKLDEYIGRASRVPGLSADLDAAQWERDVVLQRQPAAGQALREIDRLNTRRDADVAEWLATYEAMRAEIDRLTGAPPNWSHAEALQQRDAMIAANVEAQARIAELVAEVAASEAIEVQLAAKIGELHVEIEALRCNDLGTYFAGELSPERHEAFCAHLARCAACEPGLLELMQQEAIVSSGIDRGKAVIDAAVAWVRAGGTLAALAAAVNAMEET